MNTSPWDTIQVKRKKLLTRGIAALVFIWLFAPLAIVRFVCLFLFFIIIGSRLYTEYLIRNIRVSRRDPELRVFRHEWVQVELKAENRGILPAFMLVIGDLPGKLQVFEMRKIFCTLYRRSWALLYWKGLCADRGTFPIGPAFIRGADPLGLFPFTLTAKETSQLYVYPVLRSITMKNNRGIPLGNMISANPLFEDITRHRSLRPYHSGDEKRRINWKASVRLQSVRLPGGVSGRIQTGDLLVNEYEATASYPLMIFLNMDQNEYPVKNRKVKMERSIEAAAAVCLRTASERQELGIIIYISNQERGISFISPAALTLVPILERLAALDYHAVQTSPDNYNGVRGSVLAMLNQGKRLPYGTRYLYIGTDLGDEAYISLNSLKKHHLFPEYLIIDERSLSSVVPGNSPRYQMKESGYEII